jgi:D-amino peptidase
MNAFVSVDLEGMPYIVIPGQLNLKGPLYDEARRIATKITLIASDELNKNGFERVVIADSHGPMVNLLVDDLPEFVDIIRGFQHSQQRGGSIQSLRAVGAGFKRCVRSLRKPAMTRCKQGVTN